MSGKKYDDHYVGAMLEDIDHKFDAIMEGQQSLAHVPGQLENIEKRLDRMEVKSDAFEVWLKDHDKVIRSHDKRLVRLESAA